MENWEPFRERRVEDMVEESDIRGFNAEERLIVLARKLTGDFEIISVERAEPWLDVVGRVDAIITLLDLNESRVIRVPVQVKSSYIQKRLFIKNNPEFLRMGGIVIRINERRTDEEIIEELRDKLLAVVRHKIGFESFYARIARKERIAIKKARNRVEVKCSPEEKRHTPYHRERSHWNGHNTLERYLLKL